MYATRCFTQERRSPASSRRGVVVVRSPSRTRSSRRGRPLGVTGVVAAGRAARETNLRTCKTISVPLGWRVGNGRTRIPTAGNRVARWRETIAAARIVAHDSLGALVEASPGWRSWRSRVGGGAVEASLGPDPFRRWNTRTTRGHERGVSRLRVRSARLALVCRRESKGTFG
jgi:hypothetical protein